MYTKPKQRNVEIVVSFRALSAQDAASLSQDLSSQVVSVVRIHLVTGQEQLLLLDQQVLFLLVEVELQLVVELLMWLLSHPALC